MRALAAILMAAAWAMAGCDGNPNKISGTPPRPVIDVERVFVMVTPPTAVKWTDRPGPDGVVVGLYFFATGRALSTPVSGSVDVFLYEKSGAAEPDAKTDTPFITWSLTPEDLKNLLVPTQYGWAYGIRLGWGDKIPTSDRIAIQACYKVPGRTPVNSNAVTIPMSAK